MATRSARSWGPWTGALLSLLLVLATGALDGLDAQVRFRNVSFTGGVSVEGYQGNLAAVTVPLVDSTESAAAAAGEFAGAGQLVFIEGDRRQLALGLDGGLRQFAATGFEVRDYAPREWVGTADLAFRETLDWGVVQVTAGAEGRNVTDRPPIPLYIQPSFGEVRGTAAVRLREIQGVIFDGAVSAELSDYRSNEFAPLLDLLDRQSVGAEIGAAWGNVWQVRFFTGLRATSYERQGTNDPADPFRRDRALRLGAQWELSRTVLAQFGVEGTFNRSNSKRPEYDAVSFRGLLSVPLFWEMNANLFGVVTGKRYLTETEFARLVPGEEADNASVVYLSLLRPVAPNLDASVRLGWTRAETELGDSYFRRYGVGVFLHYRP